MYMDLLLYVILQIGMPLICGRSQIFIMMVRKQILLNEMVLITIKMKQICDGLQLPSLKKIYLLMRY
uniref:Uncharacterized protein n=1 Tax=Picornavirales sp. TaxID=1955153 RepID=A0A514D9G6_9VIRU|nr:MAG: hypothetical protein H4BulkLitter223_000001 [Picornavirales sp.]